MEKIIKKRHKTFKHIVTPILKFIFKIKYGYKWKKYKLDKNQNYLILSNHVTTLDPLYLSMSFNRPIYFMATEELFNKGFISKIINYFVAPIKKKKNIVDISAIKQTFQILKEGGDVAIFIEGNRTWNGLLCTINESIVKYVRKCKVPVIFFNMVGGYGHDPRWALKYRKGFLTGKIRNIISVSDIKEKTDDELYNCIIDNLTVNNFLEEYKYKSRKKAEKMERILYLCPICHSISSIYTKNNDIICNNCGLKVTYNENLIFTSENKDFKFKKIPQWYQYQLDYVKSYEISGKEKEIYKDDKVKLIQIKNNKNMTIIENGVLIMTNKSIMVLNLSHKVEFLLSEIDSFASQLRTKITFYSKGNTYRLSTGIDFNGLKYVQMYFHITNVKNGGKDEYFGI